MIVVCPCKKRMMSEVDAAPVMEQPEEPIQEEPAVAGEPPLAEPPQPKPKAKAKTSRQKG